LLRLTGMHHLAPGIRNRLEHLYGLTRAEAEITIQLAQGDGLDAIAASRAVTLETVRTRPTFGLQEDRHAAGRACLSGGRVRQRLARRRASP
jgi:hypothetical protein